MKFNFKKLKISASQKVWLNELYDEYQKNEWVNINHIKRKVWQKLTNNFKPEDIPGVLVRNNNITPIGIYHLDPKTKIFDELDKVLSSMKKLLIEKYSTDEIELTDLVDKSGLSEMEVKRLIKLIANSSNSLNQLTINSKSSNNIHQKYYIDVRNHATVDKILQFETIEKFIKEEVNPNKVKKRSGITSSENRFSPSLTYEPNTAFILMWMDKKKHDLVDVSNTIKEVCASFQIKAIRSDDIQDQDKITDAILDRIKRSEFLIADLTGERPNVYYEIGYAHSLGKHPIIFRQEGTKLHFDLSVHYAPEYKNITELKEILIKKFEERLGRKSKK